MKECTVICNTRWGYCIKYDSKYELKHENNKYALFVKANVSE